MPDTQLTPELRKHFDDYLDQIYRTYGVANAPKAEKIRVLKMIRDQEVKRGLTITPDGQQVYLTATDSPSAQGTVNQLASKEANGGIAAIKNNPQLFLWGGMVVLLILAAIILPKFLWGNKGGGEATPTPEATMIAEATPIPADYSILITGFGGSVNAKYNAPNSMEYKGQIILIQPSNSQYVGKPGLPWCNFNPDGPPNTGCWLEQSLLNPVIGFENRSYSALFSSAKPGETITVTSGSRKVEYRITSVRDISFNDTSIYTQNPMLTLVFFGERNEDGDLIAGETRHIIQAEPLQDKLAIPASVDKPGVAAQSYDGPDTIVKFDKAETKMTVRTYRVEGGAAGYLRTVVHLESPANDYSQWTYALDINNTHNAPFQASASEGGYDVVFIVPWPGDQALPFTFSAMRGDQQVQVDGTLNPPRPLEYLVINESDVTAVYEQGRLRVMVNYTMESDVEEACQECVLSVNGRFVYPNQPVTFHPTKGNVAMVEMEFRIDIVPGNMNGLEVNIGDRLFSLVPGTLTPEEATTTPTP